MHIEKRIEELGFVLPAEAQAPPGFEFSFDWARVRGNRVYVSGHSPQRPDGSLAGPFGAVPSDISLDAATDAARDAALAVLASVRRAIGDLDRVSAWLTVSGMVNADHGFTQTTTVINGFSDVVLQVFGPETGAHARSAIGVAALPMNNAVVVSAELEIDG
ncbi:transcriptional regulator [Rhodococcus sp. 14-2470-1b]|jgi:enamine deaminase RidA (YjgF/YER057c/UK114 family)|uniref:RidA family protein n=1 Tax=Rhodococcus sp. 14-2470-1b TaxID=2023149 RepID=UPI000B9BCA55|nr:RidA family protein [Rhodococcus sp. 14-2470-1b]OZF49640.1 transcriptional regulator [Rhodococcus sp. 14-2470-1b]